MRAPGAVRSERARAVAGSTALLAVLLSACATMVPQRGQVVMRDVSFPLRDFRLPSGLRVVVEEDRRVPLVAVVAVVGSGSASDPTAREGVAHMVEHLSFRARHAGNSSVRTRLERLGGDSFDAFTSLDYTTYKALMPREALPALLKLEAQRLAAPLEGITEEVFTVEREVVRNELRQRNETGYIGETFHWALESVFPAGHPYARPLLGNHDSLSRITLADVRQFARKHYRPDNVTLVITGDVDLVAIETLLKESLPEAWHGEGPPLALSPRLPQQASEPPLASASRTLVTYEAPVAAPMLYLAWVLPGGFGEAGAVQDFVEANLSMELDHARMVDSDIQEIGTELVSGAHASLLLLRVRLYAAEDPQRSADAVLDQVYKLWFTEGDAGDVLARQFIFQQMQRTAVVGMALGSEDLLRRAVRRARLTHFTLDARAYGRTEAALAALNGSKVTDFAYRWLQRDRARIFLVMPGEKDVPALLSTPGIPPDEVDETVPQRPLPAALMSPAPVTTMHLSNGLEVLLAPRPGLPLVTVGIALRGGTMSGKRGVGMMADWVAYRQSRFEGSWSDYGLRGGLWYLPDHLRHQLAGAAGNVGNILAILSETRNSLGTTSEVMRYYKEQVVPLVDKAAGYPEVKAYLALARALYGEHFQAVWPTSAELEKASQADVEDWLAAAHSPSNAVVVIAGEFDVQQVMPLVHTYLGTWQGKGAVEPPPPPEPARPGTQPELLITARPEAAHGRVQIACRLPTATPEAAVRYELMASVLRERMWHRIRERMGATYGFYAGVSMSAGGAANLLLEDVVDLPQLGASMAAGREVLAAYALEGVSATELERARSRLLADHAVSLVTSADWVDALLKARVMGWSPEAVTQRPALLQAVTSAELQKEFAGCVERLVVGVIGDEGKARTAAQAAFSNAQPARK